MNLPQLNEFETEIETNVDLDIRSVRRSIKSVERTLMNVSVIVSFLKFTNQSGRQ